MIFLRPAGSDDAEQVARLHADSWRRHYRGAYADSFLDGDVVRDRLAVWSSRLSEPANSATLLAIDGNDLVGFVHVVLDADERWGSLVDNLHVARDRQRGGIGRTLLASAADVVQRDASGSALYLWVLEQNTAAQAFYRALGGSIVERDAVQGPGGPGRLNGSPHRFRIAWSDCSLLKARY